MSSDFIIIPRGPRAARKETSPAALAQEWFASVRGVKPETVARLREQVQRELETGACRHLLPKMPAEHLPGVELQRCVEQVITEQWDSLTPEERLLTRFPTVQAVGEQFEIPKRGTGVIVQRELTRRFGVEMVFKLRDGSFFKWEFID
ncbi:MAG: hypothetical protein ABSC03_00140 [Verrucomicrobiota bacterium]|jgi:hypothetical protein